MVLRGLNFKCDNINRKKHVLVCLRKDKESILGNTLTEYLKIYLKNWISVHMKKLTQSSGKIFLMKIEKTAYMAY